MERFSTQQETIKPSTSSRTARAVIVEAHNDDMSLFRLTNSLVQRGVGVSVVTLTDGSARDLQRYSPLELPDVRWKEGGIAGEIAGIEQRTRINIPDGRLTEYSNEGVNFLHEHIETYKPDFVVAPHPFDEHPDHAAAAKISAVVSGGKMPLYSMDTITGRDATSRNLMPDAYIRLPRRTARREKRIYLANESQVTKLPGDETLAIFDVLGMTARRGSEIGLPHAAVIYRANNHKATPIEDIMQDRLVA